MSRRSRTYKKKRTTLRSCAKKIRHPRKSRRGGTSHDEFVSAEDDSARHRRLHAEVTQGIDAIEKQQTFLRDNSLKCGEMLQQCAQRCNDVENKFRTLKAELNHSTDE